MMTKTRTRNARPIGRPEWELVTPDDAYELLTHNPRNRALDPKTVAQYAADMRNGDFTSNGETIKIDVRGNLIDGQHRLMAVVETEAPVWFLVVRDLPTSAQDTVDIGRRRQLGQQLQLDGDHNGNVLAAAGRMIYAYERTGVPVTRMLSVKPTDQQVRAVLDRHADLRDAAAKYPRGTTGLSRSTVVGLYYLFTYADADDAGFFFTKLASGAGLEPKDPILVLRERLMREKMSTSRRIDIKVVTAFVIRAFNAYRRGETIHRLVWSDDQVFPRIEGITLPVLGDDETEE